MNLNKRGLIVAVVLAIILGIIVIYSKGFETILYKYFSSKTTQGSRTLLLVYFIEHIWMVLLSSIIAVTLGIILGVFVTTKYGHEFKEILLK